MSAGVSTMSRFSLTLAVMINRYWPPRSIETKPQRPAAPPLARAVSKVTRDLARKSKRAAPVVLEDWAEIVGPELADHCRPAIIRGAGPRRTLTIDACECQANARLAAHH